MLLTKSTISDPHTGEAVFQERGIEAETLSCFRSSFATDYGVRLMAGPMEGLCARSVVVLDADNNVIYNQLLDDIVNEPDYDAALAALG